MYDSFSETRLGDILKFLVKKIISKVAQILGDFLGYFEKDDFLFNTAEESFWQVLGKIRLLFI